MSQFEDARARTIPDDPSSAGGSIVLDRSLSALLSRLSGGSEVD
jgi:hypothetical protein